MTAAASAARYVALLRGINVGGNKKIAMDHLRAFVESLGAGEARTLLQTGNVLFTSKKTPAALETLLQREASARLGLTTDFFVRSTAEWQAVVAGNPFPREAEQDPSHLVVVCLKQPATREGLAALRASIRGPERVEAEGRHAYVVYPAGIGTSKLTAAVIDARLRTRGTARNWNTVLKIVAALEG